MPISSNLPDTAVVVFEADGVRVVDHGPRLDVILCSPENRNAQTPRTWGALAGVRAHITESTRAIVVSAEGASFSAGLDRSMLGAPTAENPVTLASIGLAGEGALRDFITEAQSAFNWWREVAPVTIAVVNGHAIGAGFQLALACDLVLALPDASFSMRESRLGLIPDLGGTRALVRAVGYSRALEICATGRAVEAAEAVSLGIAQFALGIAQFALGATKVPEQVDEIVGAITAPSGGVVGSLKQLLREAEDSAPDLQLQHEREAQIRRIAALMREAT